MAVKHTFDGRLGDALRELARLGTLRAQGATRHVWATPAARYVRALAATKFDEVTLREQNIPTWAINAILRERCRRERCRRPLQGVRAQ